MKRSMWSPFVVLAACTGTTPTTDLGPRPDAAAPSPDAQVCVADVQSDPQNCGSCGHDCLGGACVAGACQPITLATGQLLPVAAAVDANNVYWTVTGHTDSVGSPTGDGSVMRLPLPGGGAPVAIATGQIGPFNIAITATDVYWTNSGSYLSTSPYTYKNDGRVMKAAISGGTAVAVATGISPVAVTVDATNVYWTNFGSFTWNGSQYIYNNDGSVKMKPLAGGTETVLATGLADDIKVDATSVYWSVLGTFHPDNPSNESDGSVVAKPFGGSATTIAAGLANVGRIAVGPSGVAFVTRGTATVPDGTVQSVSGGNKAVLASSQAAPSSVAFDAGDVYWTNWGLTPRSGTVMKMPRAGGAAVILATGQAYPTGIVVAGNAIYWVNEGSAANVADGTVMKLAK